MLSNNPTGSSRRQHTMPFGANLTERGVAFRLWAPKHKTLRLKIEGDAQLHTMTPEPGGWHTFETGETKSGTRYQFVLPNDLHVPDPASRFQPDDVHGMSEVIDPRAYAWRDSAWRGRPWEECVLYELHVGAFTPEGTFRAAIGKLDHLRELGVTAIELMPVADFPGKRNWGYDGVLLFAPDSSYGRPEDFKALVDEAHARGIMVFLDVVYNHFGPDGNYLPTYAPIFTERHHTPWGAAVNYDAEDSQAVRSLVVENAVYWIDEYHLDGLRLDAVHAILDESEHHILKEIASRVSAAAEGRHVHLVLENEENAASLIARGGDGRPAAFTAQWNDDMHHVLHTAVTGENAGYYVEYAGRTDLLGRALAEGFAFQGEMMTYRGHPRGESSLGLPPTAFVTFLQNHDQVGNRAFGDRITDDAPAQAVRAAAAIYLLAPQIPMLFMGEEWAAAQPFPFFCDFEPELAEAVRNGRRNEFAKFPEFADPVKREKIPDPTAAATFVSAKLAWDEARTGVHADWLAWYRKVLAIRHAEIIPRLAGMAGHSGRHEVLANNAVSVQWTLGDGATLTLAANLSATPLAASTLVPGRVVWTEGEATASGFGPWTVVWSIVDGPA